MRNDERSIFLLKIKYSLGHIKTYSSISLLFREKSIALGRFVLEGRKTSFFGLVIILPCALLNS